MVPNGQSQSPTAGTPDSGLSHHTAFCRPHQTGTQQKGLIWKRTRQSYKNKQDPQQRQIKQADLEMLELAAAAGEIELKYLDESGFCMWSPVSYTYFPRGQQKRLEQTRRRGRRLSILGLIQPLISFAYGLVIGSFTSKSYTKMMEQQAQLAPLTLSRHWMHYCRCPRQWSDSY